MIRTSIMKTIKVRTEMKRYIITCMAALMGVLYSQAESISVGDVFMNQGETTTVAISLTNSHTDLVSFQMDLYLPDGITINRSGCSLSNRFESGQTLTIGKQADGAYRLTSTSFSLTPITGTSGTIISLSLTAQEETGPTSATLKNIMFATNNSERITLNNVSFMAVVREHQTVNLATLLSLTYGDAYTLPSKTDQGQELTWTVSNNDVATISENVITTKNAGSTTVTATQAGTNIYLPFTKTYTLDVNKASLTVKAKDATRLYFEDEPAFDYICSGFVYNDDEQVLTKLPDLTTDATKTSNVGKYKIIPSGAEAKNYEFLYEQGELTITKRTLKATSHATRMYGEDNPLLPIEYDGFVNNETEAVISKEPVGISTATKTSSVNVYPITVSGGEATNYDFVYEQGALTVAKASLSAKVKDVTKVYGSPNPTLSIEYYGLKNGEIVPAWITRPTIQTEATQTSDAGQYAIKAINGVAINYDLVIDDGTLNITPATLTVKVKDATRLYFEDEPAFDYICSGFVNNDDEQALTKLPDLTTDATKTSNAGKYRIIPSGAEAKNYTISYEQGELTITKRTLKATSHATRMYGDENPLLPVEYDGFVNNETETVLSKKPVGSSSATTTSNVGLYPITVSGGEATNYEFVYEQGTLTVAKASLSAKVKDATKVYGSQNPTFSIEYYGLKNGETVPEWTTQPTIQTEATQASGVGQYAIKAINGVATNYDLEIDDGTLNITPATLTVKATDATRLYFEDEPAFGFICSGFVNNDDVQALTKLPDFTTDATKTSNVGKYRITPSGAEAKNYTISYEQGELTITKRTLKATSHATRMYGDENPLLPVEYDGFVNNETETVLSKKPVGSSSATTTSNVGLYPITVSGGEATNYEFVYEQGTLTVAKASLSAKVKDATKVYGSQNPTFSIEYYGLKNGETVPSWTTAPTFQTDATKNSGVGEYAIKAIGGVAENYDISFADGALTITKRTLTVSVGDYERIYNEENPVFKVNYSGFVGDEDENILTKKPSAITEATKTTDVGIYPITITEGLADNYIFSYSAGTLTINKAEQSITWEQDLSVLHVGDQLKLTAVASSGLPVIFQSLNSSIAEVNSTNTEYYLGCIEEGKAQIVAIQEGNNNYNAAQRIIKDLVIEKLSLRGDVNGDGVVNMDDVTFVANIILGIENATDAADVNNDGTVNMSDVMFIVNYIKNGEFPDE